MEMKDMDGNLNRVENRQDVQIVEAIPDAESLGNLWNDRRQSASPLKGPERRSGQDRRTRVSREPGSRRGTSVKYSVAKSGRLQAVLIAGMDLIMLCGAFLMSFILYIVFEAQGPLLGMALESQRWGLIADYARIFQFFVVSLIAVAVFWLRGHYSRRQPFWDEFHSTSKLLLLFACLEATAIFISGARMPRMWIIGTWVLALPLLPWGRYMVRRILSNFGLWSRPTVIIGTGKSAQDIAAALANEVGLGFHVAAFLVPPPKWLNAENENHQPIPRSIEVNGRKIPVRRLGTHLERTLHLLGTPHLVIALDTDDLWEVSKLLLGKNLPYSSLTIAPSIRGLPLIGMEMLHFFKEDVMLLRIQNNLSRFLPQVVKRGFDLVVAFLLLAGLGPVMLLIMAAIRSSGPQVIFGHPRLGKDGKRFRCYKFRTMVPNAQEMLKKLLESDAQARAEWERDFKLKNDPRVTKIGRFLRKTSLDELPQLWNVLRGEMSLVGPRPIIEQELEKYENKKDFFLEAKPGITGLWQVSGRNDVTYEERVQLDAWYARNWHLWYDIVILLKTVLVVFGKKGAY